MKSLTPFIGTSLLIMGISLLLTKQGKGFSHKSKGDSDKFGNKTFDPDAGEPIGRVEAAKYAKKYQQEYKQNTSSNYCNKEIIKDILANEDSVGLRIYRVLNGKTHGIILIGVDKYGEDILPGKEVDPAAARAAQSYDKCPLNCDGTTLVQD